MRAVAKLQMLTAHRAARLGFTKVALTIARAAARQDDTWSEPLLWSANWQLLVGDPSRALEDLIGANSLSPRDRRVMLSLAFALDEMGICGEAYEWHCRAAHLAGESETPPTDSEAEAMYWHALGRFCLRHDQHAEAVDVAALAVLASDFPGRLPIA